MTQRVYNFCAGPAAMPELVLEKVQRELLDFQGKGMSVMEMSHRSDVFLDVRAKAEQDLRDLMNIGDDYRVLFLQGGASSQFSLVPMNLQQTGQTACYLNSGQWSKKAIAEAKRLAKGAVDVLAQTDFSCAPTPDQWALSGDRADPQQTAYLHYTPNETIGGVEFDYVPETGDIPLVADFSSSILSHEIDVNRYGLIYAGAQKNIGPAGLCVVIVKSELLERSSEQLPSMMNYRIHAQNDSLYNTPPTFSIYLAGQIFAWLKAQGGVAKIAEVNRRKAAKLYDYIDNSGFYRSPVLKAHRSKMNVPFILPDESLNDAFLAFSEKDGLYNLAGHRSVGGMRASLYNAIPEQAVDALIECMDDFAKTHR